MDVERRSLLKGLAAGLTGAVVTPSPSDAEALATVAAASDAHQQAAAPPAASSGLLDLHQRQTLASLADLILPGAAAAGAVERIDRVAAVESPAAQRRLLNAIARFDQEARGAAGGRWLDLSDAGRLDILARASTSPSGLPVRAAWTRGQPVVVPVAAPAAALTLRDHLEYLKSTIGAAYASTEAGMRALGWTGQSSWRELPGCSHPDPAHD